MLCLCLSLVRRRRCLPERDGFYPGETEQRRVGAHFPRRCHMSLFFCGVGPVAGVFITGGITASSVAPPSTGKVNMTEEFIRLKWGENNSRFVS